MNTQLFAITATSILTVVFGSTVEGAPPVRRAFTYQGKLTDTNSGDPVTTSADLRFRMYDAIIGGTLVGSEMTATDVDLNDTDGTFTVDLSPDDGTFDGTQLFLEIHVRVPHDPSDSKPFESLSGRQPLYATPYAHFALNGVGPWTQQPGQLLTNDNVGIGAKPNQRLHIHGDLVQTPTIALTSVDAPAGDQSLPILNEARTGDFYLSRLADDGSGDPTRTDLMVQAQTGRVGIGTLTPQEELHLNGDLLVNDGTQSLSNSINLNTTAPGGSTLSMRNMAGMSTIVMEANEIGFANDGGQITFYNDLGIETLELDGDRSNGGRIELSDSGGAVNVTISGGTSANATGGFIAVDQADSSVGVEIDGYAGSAVGGRVSIYGPSGTESVLIRGALTSEGGDMQLRNPDGVTTVRTNAGSSTNGGYLVLNNETGQQTIELDADEGDHGIIRLARSTGVETLILDSSESTVGGRMIMRNLNGITTLTASAGELAGEGGELQLENPNGVTTFRANAGSSTNGGYLVINNDAGQRTVELDGDENEHGVIRLARSDGLETIVLKTSEAANQGATLALRDDAGNLTIELDADFNGEGRVITDVLEITGGSDLSEQFDVTSEAVSVQAGMIVCIDPANPGNLVVSTRTYDRRVAGVISGAGGIKPGMLMGQRNTQADGKFPVALTGRVYVMCDAAGGSIEPGDLLTTSATPGHAMKVTDMNRAQGAMIGKAMSSLVDETGLVLVLVNLQ